MRAGWLCLDSRSTANMASMEALEGTFCCAKDCDEPVSGETRTPLGSGVLVLPLCEEHNRQWAAASLWPIEIVSSFDTARARFEPRGTGNGLRGGCVEAS